MFPGQNVRPVSDGKAVVQRLFPNVYATDSYRDPTSPLGRQNPEGWHSISNAGVDVRPIPGMTFQQYVDKIREHYYVIEALDEATYPIKDHTTGPHWHVVIGEKQ